MSFKDLINMQKYLTLEQRISKLELMLEAKIDQERLLNFLGQEYYDKYNLIKNKITDPNYKDIYKMMKMDVDEVKDFIDSFQSKTFKRNVEKEDGAELLYVGNGWKVYKITTYKAAQIYGRNTKWCITGNYEGHEERGEEYFYDYIDKYKLDDGYYFYIKSNDEKYCVLQTRSRKIDSIWNIQDEQIRVGDLPENFPMIKEVNLDVNAELLYSDDVNKVKQGIALGQDLEQQLYLITPFENALRNKNVPVMEVLAAAGANCQLNNTGWYYLVDYDAIKRLANAGVDFTKIDFMHEPYLFSIMTNKELTAETVELLISYGVKAFGMSRNSSTIKRAISSKRADILEVLLNNCSAKQINKIYPDGNTALHYAVKSKASVAIIKMLLDAGADPNVANENGELPVDLAKNTRIIDLLNQH